MVDQLRYRIALELLHTNILQDFLNSARFLVFRIKPFSIELGFEDQRHSVVDILDRVTGIRGDYRAGFVGARFDNSVLILPDFP